jgi:hypothetical protein
MEEANASSIRLMSVSVISRIAGIWKPVLPRYVLVADGSADVDKLAAL